MATCRALPGSPTKVESRRLLSSLCCAIVGAACIITTGEADMTGENDTTGDADGGTSAGSDTQGNASPGLSFPASNIPAEALAMGAPGDLIFDGAHCDGGSVAEIDTDTGEIRDCSSITADSNYRYTKAAQADGSMIGLFVTRTFRVETTITLKARGQLPLVVVALDRAEILGTLDLAPDDNRGIAGGFSAPVNMKGDGNGPGAGAGAGIGGGAGGSYCGLGGEGGGGNRPGRKYGTAELVPLLAGSSGGNGSIYEAGAGGGAVQIIAADSLTVTETGRIHVGGADGLQHAGGGSGGAILLESPEITVAGMLAANGGGGGSSAGSFGDGAAGEMIDGGDGSRTDDAAFSGGGGGGAGYIRLNTRMGMATITGTISPSLGTVCASEGTLR